MEARTWYDQSMIEAMGENFEVKAVLGGPINGQARVCRVGERSVVVRCAGGFSHVYRIDADAVRYVGWTDEPEIAHRAAAAVADGEL